MTFISEGKYSLLGLEEDALIQIISFLEPPDILRLAQVCHYSLIDINYSYDVTLTDMPTFPRNYGPPHRLGQCMQILCNKQRLSIPQ